MDTDEQMELMWAGAAAKRWRDRVGQKITSGLRSRFGAQLGPITVDMIIEGMRQAFEAGFQIGAAFEYDRRRVPGAYRQEGVDDGYP